jgi:DeoR family fructose operon transcriptional repressor
MINEAIVRDLAPERRQRLCTLVRSQGVIRVEEICRTLKVSPATVRRDLETLERRGQLRRVHGGAISLESRLDEPPFEDKATIALSEKRAISARALTLIQRNDTVYLDGGSTVLELARLLKERSDITLVTNSLQAASELSGAGPRLILIGGELRRRSQTLVGALTRFVLDQIHVDKAFMGTMGFSFQEGLTTTDPDEALTKAMVAKRAEQVILLAHSDKAGKISFAKAGDFNDVDVLITGPGLLSALRKKIKTQNVDILTATKLNP